MAHAVIGGLITSTLLTLVVVPVVYTYLDDFGAWCGVWARKFFSKPGGEAAAHTTHVPAKPTPEPAPAPQPAAGPAGAQARWEWRWERPRSHRKGGLRP